VQKKKTHAEALAFIAAHENDLSIW
jgi:hypothetical protein